MKTVLILSGPTQEYFDPVRYIGNASSGKMGRALAQEASHRGWKVEFISGPVSEAHLPDGGCITRVVSAAHMLAAAQEKLSFADLILFAAAVADYRPISRATEKLPKQGTHLLLELEPTPDIAATLCARKRAGQTAIGFALQTHDGEAKAREKLLSKRLDGIVLNTPTSLGADSGSFTWIDRRSTEPWGELDKAECARHIFEKAAALALQIDPAR